MEETKVYDLDALQSSEERIKNAFDELDKSVVEYYHDFGEHNGMDFTYEFVKYADAIQEYRKKYETIFKRVRKRIEYKNAQVNNGGSRDEISVRDSSSDGEHQQIKRRKFK